MKSDWKSLRKLGLTQTEIDCYVSLYEEGSCEITTLAGRTGHPKTSLYRYMRRLEARGFVTISGRVIIQDQPDEEAALPTCYHANKLDDALLGLAKYQENSVQDLLQEERIRIAAQRQQQKRGY